MAKVPKRWKGYSLQHVYDFVTTHANRKGALAHMEISQSTFHMIKTVVENGNYKIISSVESGKVPITRAYNEVTGNVIFKHDSLGVFSDSEKDDIGKVGTHCSHLIKWAKTNMRFYLEHLGKKAYGDTVQVNAINAHYRLMIGGHSNNYFQMLGIKYSLGMDKQLGTVGRTLTEKKIDAMMCGLQCPQAKETK